MNAEKRERLTEALRRGVAGVLLDARQQGVDVPDHCRSADLKLNFSNRYLYPPELSDWGLRCVLSFSGENCPVAIPWAAIWAIQFLPVEGAQGGVYLWEAPPAPLPLTKRRGHLGLVQQ